MKYYALIFYFTLLVLARCQPIKTIAQIPDEKKLFSYERTPCFGYCPTYEVIVLKNGETYFAGKRFVPVMDTVAFHLPNRTLQQIKAILNHSDYIHLTIEEPEHQIMDIPGLKLMDYKNMRQYELDQIIPGPIEAITDRMDAVLKSKKFLYDEKTFPMVREEIILQLKPETDPYTMDGNEAFYQLSYRKDIGKNIYLFEIITAKDALEKALRDIKQHRGVIEVQKNHQLERRQNTHR